MFGKLLTTVLVSGLCTFAVCAAEVEPWFGAPIPASGEKPIPDCGMTAARIFDAPISGLERIGSMAIPTTADLPESANTSIGFECLDRGLFDPDRCYDALAAVGIKWARCQTMWSRCEKQKGVYDFTVLDGVVDNLTRRGIRPWFCVSFGNTLYMTNCYTGAAVGCVPTLYGDECRAAWCAYVRALAWRYKGKVTHWEIWNEPNLKHFWQPSKPNAIDYLDLVKLTGGIIREEIPDAKIGGTTSMPAIQEWETAFFEAGGAALIDFWCGHGYAPSPESIRPKWRIATCDSIDYVTVLKEVRAFIDAHGGKHLEIWQGEAGFASWFPENHQLWVPGICKEGWQSQANQAKWLLRRFITDRRAGIARSSFFQMADISRHYSMATVTKKHPAEHGIVNGWTYKPKMSYWAFGHYNALLATARHDESVAVSLTPASDADAPTIATTFRTPGDAPLFIYYTAFDFSGNYTGTCYTARCDAKLTLPAALAPKDPVLVDMLRGGVYAVSNRLRLQEGDHVTFSGLPLVDYPLLVADRSQIKMKKGGTSGAPAPDSVGRLTVEAPPGGDRVVGFAKKELLRVLKGVEGRIVLREEKDLKPQQWRFRSEADGTLVISGRDGMGIAYGVFTFLEKHAGAAWYAPDTEVLPDLQGWKLPRLDETGAPAFLDREMYVGNDYMDTTWRLRNKETRRAAYNVGLRYGKPGACHTFAAYTKALKAAHPELFGKRLAANGRVCSTLCLTDPVTRTFVAEEMCRYIEQDAEAARKSGAPSYAVPSIYEISQDDGGSSGECMCERCKALAEAEGSYSGPMIDFASEVARRVGARHPEVFVETFAYSYTMKPPKTVKGADNLIVRYCDSHVFAPLLRGTPPGDVLEEWGRHAANISVWGYWRNYTGTPLPMMKRIADIGAELRFARDCHVKTYFAEDEAPLSRSFAMLQHWLFLKLTENPDQDEQALAQRFMSAYYGAAARPMTLFRDYLERRQESTYAYLDREFFEKANAWLDEAERLVADDARSRSHVRWERVIVDRGAFRTFADTRKQGYKMDVKAVAARLKANHRELLKGWSALKTGGKTALETRLKAADDEAMIYANYPVAIPERFAGKTVVDRLSINQVPSAGKLVSDPDAAAGYAFYIPKTKAELPFSFGFYHAASKSLGSVGFKTKADVPQDEKFHLYRLGRSVLLKGFYVWFDPTWRYRCWEQTIGIVPEEWDVWVSAKFTGPAFVEGSQNENRVLFDRVLFVKEDTAGMNCSQITSDTIVHKSQIPIVGGPTSVSAIVVPDDRPDDVPKHLAAVARELAHDIEESTGMRLPVVSAKDARPKTKCIYIGETFAEQAGLLPKDRPLENFDSVVAEKDGSVYLFGHDRTRFADPSRKAQWWRYCLLASGRAVVSFMENEMGVAFLAPGRAGRDIPKKKFLAVPKGLYRLRRESQIAGVSRELEMMYDLASGIYGLGTWRSHGGHLYPAAVPFAKYAKTHPEYFPLHGNARVKSNGVNALCISNPEVEQLLVDFIVAEMDDGADIVELGQNDGTSWCRCEKCRAFAGTAPDDWGEKFWIFHRRIAEKVNALRPEKTVQIISYGPTAMPPRTFTEFPPNVMIELMNCRPAALSAWRNYKVARGFSNYVYHWGDYPSPGFTAKNSIAAMAAAARKYREYGIKIVYRCGYGELFGTEGPSYYVFNKLLFDPSLDEKVVFGQYVSRAYGPAAKTMMKFHTLQDGRLEMYNALDAGIDGNRRVVPKHAADMLAAMYPPDVLAQLGNLLAAAERTAGLSAKHAMRLRLVRLEYEYLVRLIRPIHLYFGYLASPSAETFRPLADALESRASFIDSLGDGKGRVRGIESWDRLHPFFPNGRFNRKMMSTNGRLSARLDAPFAWDAKAMLAKGFLPGKTKVEARVPRLEWRSGGVRECGSEGNSPTHPLTHSQLQTFDFEQGAWAAAKWNELNGLQLEKIANRTRFKAVAGTDALYLAVETTLPDDRKYEPTGHDSSCYLRDCIDFAIAPDMAGDKAYHFVFGPVENSSLEEALGLITDELDPKYGTYDGEWNGEWSYAPVRADGIWRTRVKIPYATLGVPRPVPGAKWRMNLGRLAEPDATRSTPYAYCEFSSWSPNFESRSFSDLGAMGEVVFE